MVRGRVEILPGKSGLFTPLCKLYNLSYNESTSSGLAPWRRSTFQSLKQMALYSEVSQFGDGTQTPYSSKKYFDNSSTPMAFAVILTHSHLKSCVRR